VAAVNTGLAVPVYVISVYLTTKIGMVEPNVSYLGGLLQLVSLLPGPWVAGGGWNMEPQDLQEWARRVRGVVAATGEATCGSSKLDFFICSQTLASSGMEVVSVLGTPVCTHVPVLLKLRRLHARATVTAAEGSDPRGIQQAAGCWFMHAEDPLCQLHDVYERRRGRAVGLKLKRAPLAQEWSRQFRARSSLEFRQLQVIEGFLIEDDWWPFTGALANVSIAKVVMVLRSGSAAAAGYMLEALDDHLLQLRQRDAQVYQSEWKAWACAAAQEKGGRAAFGFVRAGHQVQPSVFEMLDEEQEQMMPLGGDAAMEKLMQQRGPLWQHELREDEIHPYSWRGAESDVEELPRLTLQNLGE
ncbi:unnamed protein product, partial [Prorocentrum cordatum]